MNDRLDSILAISPVIPVVTLTHADDAVPLARALNAGGIGIIEVTLRSEAALDGIRAIVADVPNMVVGAGTCLSAAQLKAARTAGCAFAVSPGATPTLLEAASALALPLLAGAATVSEMMRLAESGHTRLKMFPAEASGGAAFLKAVGPVLPEVRFCPTGGITSANASAYLALANVACVGGTWITPPDLMAQGRWGEIEVLARAAVALEQEAYAQRPSRAAEQPYCPNS